MNSLTSVLMITETDGRFKDHANPDPPASRCPHASFSRLAGPAENRDGRSDPGAEVLPLFFGQADGQDGIDAGDDFSRGEDDDRGHGMDIIASP